MIAADSADRTNGKLLTVGADGQIRHRPRADLAMLFDPGDLVVANDAATLPASLFGTHAATGKPIEIRLAGWISPCDPTRFVAIVFGAGDHRTPTERRPPPPELSPGDGIALGPLVARVGRVLGHPRLVEVRFAGCHRAILDGIARHGRPIQYAHVPERLALSDVWTRIAARPVAFEPPSAGFALDWRMIAAWRRRGIGFATLTHAAGIASTGDPALDRRLPFDEPYHLPRTTVAAVERARSAGGRVVAIGTTVVRALEAAAGADGKLRPGEGVATGRIARGAQIGIVDLVLSGVHQPGESHYELLAAFADDGVLHRMTAALDRAGYRGHEFGDSVLIERPRRHMLRPGQPSGASQFGPRAISSQIDTEEVM